MHGPQHVKGDWNLPVWDGTWQVHRREWRPSAYCITAQVLVLFLHHNASYPSRLENSSIKTSHSLASDNITVYLIHVPHRRPFKNVKSTTNISASWQRLSISSVAYKIRAWLCLTPFFFLVIGDFFRALFSLVRPILTLLRDCPGVVKVW